MRAPPKWVAQKLHLSDIQYIEKRQLENCQSQEEIVAILIAVVYAFFFTLILFRLINKFIPVRVSEHVQTVGLDLVHHGEVARQN